MNRQIKFRVYDEFVKHFWYVEWMPTLGFVWTNAKQLNVGENYPQQCANLKDKNNKEIYEGDILYCSNRTFGQYVEVIFDNYLGMFLVERRPIVEFFEFNSIELVGNINQTPELVKKL